MFAVYLGKDCVCGGYKTEDEAIHAISVIIARNIGFILASGHDGNNWWYVVRFYDENDFAEYECFSIRKNCK